jgi:hypothetical protein
MNLEKARAIVEKYGAALAKEEAPLRRESLLPSDKNTIIKATKLFIAYLIEFHGLTEDSEQSLISSIGYITAFVPDREAIEVNHVLESFTSGQIPSGDPRVGAAVKKATDAMYSSELADDIQRFIYEVHQLDREDPLYHQRIYTLAGIEYSLEKKRSFWASLFG